MTVDTPLVGRYEGGTWPLTIRIPASVNYPRWELIDVARHYVNWGLRFGLRADVAWAQMMYETDSLRFSGQVNKGQNNFCGLKTTSGSMFASFATLERGVIAHYAHLAAYAFDTHVRPECSDRYDPRHNHALSAQTVGELSGQWAPSADYGEGIVSRWNG